MGEEEPRGREGPRWVRRDQGGGGRKGIQTF